MNPELVLLAAHCTLLTGTVDLSREDGVWVEQIELAVSGDGRCDEVRIPLGPEATALPGKARIQLWDDTVSRLDEHRWSMPDRDHHGHTELVLAVPELGPGDVVRLTAERRIRTTAAWRWRPEGARFARVSTDSGTVTAQGDAVTVDREAGIAQVSEPDHQVELRVLSGEALPTPPAPGADDLPTALAIDAALARAQVLTVVDLGQPGWFGGAAPSTWTATLQERGWLTPREWAAWLVMATRGGPEPLQPGFWLPEPAAPGDLEAASVPLVVAGDRAWAPPGVQLGSGRVVLADGSSTEAKLQPFRGPEPASVHPRLHRTLTLEIPDGDVQRTLFDGKGTLTRTEDRWELPGEGVRTWVISLPEGATGLRIEADEGVTVWQRPDHLAVLTDRGSGTAGLTVHHTRTGVPTFGEAPRIEGVASSLTVEVPSGEIGLDDNGSWWLRSAHGQDVIPDRDTLLYSLEARFGYLSMPEPGLPVEFKFREADLAGLGSLPDALYTRAVPEPIPHPELWPRPIKKARGTGAVSPVEAALIVTRYAQQLRAGAEWVLVRPASTGPGGLTSPSGYTDALVYVWGDSGGLWLDPGCRWCGPGELRPDLTGASALSWSFSQSPAPQPGSLVVTRDEQGVRLHAEGPPAVAWRQRASAVPAEYRDVEVASWLGGEQAKLTAVEGLGDPGEPLVLAASTDRTGVDPLALPSAEPDGRTWIPWLGHRRWEGAKVPPMPMDVRIGNALRYVRTVADDGAVTEDLWVWRRRITAEERLRLELLRRPAPRPL